MAFPAHADFYLKNGRRLLENSDKKAALFYSHQCFPRRTPGMYICRTSRHAARNFRGRPLEIFLSGRARQNEHLIRNANRGSEHWFTRGVPMRYVGSAVNTKPCYFGQLLWSIACKRQLLRFLIWFWASYRQSNDQITWPPAEGPRVD